MTDHLQRAIDLAVGNVADGGGPFGAVVVAPSGKEFTGVNRVTAIPDPTAHAEVQRRPGCSAWNAAISPTA